MLSRLLLSLTLAVTAGPCLCSIATGAPQADEEVKQHHFRFQTERVIVFKDGYCLVVKSGRAKTDSEGRAYSKDVPDAAVLGSFWALPKKDAVIQSMIAGWEKSEEVTPKEFDCTNVGEIIQANLGRSCSLHVDDDIIRGTLHKLLGTSVTPQSASRRAAPNVSVASHCVCRTETGDLLIPVSAIRRVVIEEMKTKLTREVRTSSREKLLTFQFAQRDQQVEITYLYFRPGMRWIPTYRLQLTDKPSPNKDDADDLRVAEMSLQCELLNEAEDLIDAPIDVVVGVPNFRFRSVPSPMVLEAKLNNLLVQAAPQIMGNDFRNNGMSNALYSQRSAEIRSNRAANRAPSVAALPEELSAQGTNDLFVYSLPKMTLRSGERATIPILSTQARYRDVYTWDIQLSHATTYAATSSDAISPLVLAENKVWRQVELVNDTKLPWTTGAAMFVDGSQPLAQELLTYTSPGGICRVPVTVAVDLRGTAKDQEVSRDLKSLQWRGYSYARVRGKIDIELANNKQVDTPVEVRIRFGGKATKVSDDGEIRLEPFRKEDWTNRNGDVINNSSLVTWKAVIEPGDCFKPVIDYEFYTRH